MQDFPDYKHYKTQDFVWDDSFRSWVLEGTTEDTIYWTRFMARFPEKEAEITLAREIILQMTVRGPVLSDIQAQEIVDGVMQRTAGYSSVRGAVIGKWANTRKKVVAVAAGVLMVLAITAGLLNLLQENDDLLPIAGMTSELQVGDWIEAGTGQLTEKTNAADDPETIKLADGSEIVLESGSTIRYATSFASKEFREIHLIGNAFFDVKRDTSRPFLVYANGTVTKVLGTSFWIYAPKSNEEQATVEVISGVVTVYPTGDKRPREVITKSKIGEVILTRNQKVEYSKKHNSLVTALVDNPIAIDNKSENNKFIDFPILEIVQTLSAEYGIEIIHDDNLLVGRTFTADLSGLTMYQKLDVICKTINANYEVINGKVIIL